MFVAVVDNLMEIAVANENDYVIAGPILNEEQTYWHNDRGWITDLGEATTLPREIITNPLPPGAAGIMELTPDGPVAFYTPYPSYGEGP